MSLTCTHIHIQKSWGWRFSLQRTGGLRNDLSPFLLFPTPFSKQPTVFPICGVVVGCCAFPEFVLPVAVYDKLRLEDFHAAGSSHPNMRLGSRDVDLECLRFFLGV